MPGKLTFEGAPLVRGTRNRHRRVLVWSAIVSAALHVVVLSLLFYAFARIVITPSSSGEQLTERTTISVEAPIEPKVPPRPRALRKPARMLHLPPAHHELAKQTAAAPAQPPPRPRAAALSPLQRDRTAFANEVAQLNRGNDPHAIPTIDPASAQAATKSYGFSAGRSNGNQQYGNGIITPTRSWQQDGLDCYYARYEYTYPNGASEEGTIVWPVCYNPGSDPFHQPPHPMAFPLPLAGYTLPPGTELPPLEKQAYEQWAASNAVH